ncbi:hypothetical protein FZ983_27300 [Azospirillum sp. B21]|uniref:hypothetical protein n=1 Tax=Azospirillum sp. B21 TaxID=2607496 RepID=UPI0011ED9392|nr:hypothetical protein [Azospirillum sp. B21]KAA0574609.1 hypothetical protein FZ983_27300 [Azospirillum sp. B21]
MNLGNNLLVPVLVVAGIALLEIHRRRYQRLSGERIQFFAFLWKMWDDPRSLILTKPNFNGRNGFILVGWDWVLVLAGFVTSMRWAVSGAWEDALAPGVFAVAVIGIAVSRVLSGRTGETPWRAGPAPR